MSLCNFQKIYLLQKPCMDNKVYMIIVEIQWNPSCEATHFVPEKWSFKRGGLSSGVEINTFKTRFKLSSGLS